MVFAINDDDDDVERDIQLMLTIMTIMTKIMLRGSWESHFQEGSSDTEWEDVGNLLVLPPPTPPF